MSRTFSNFNKHLVAGASQREAIQKLVGYAEIGYCDAGYFEDANSAADGTKRKKKKKKKRACVKVQNKNKAESLPSDQVPSSWS